MCEGVRQEAHVSFPHNNSGPMCHFFPIGLHQACGEYKRLGQGRDLKDMPPSPTQSLWDLP